MLVGVSLTLADLGAATYSPSLVIKRETPAARLPNLWRNDCHGQHTVSNHPQFSCFFWMSGVWMPPQAFSHPGGQMRQHSLSSEGQKRKYDHLRCNSCLCLLSFHLTVFSFHWAYNQTYDTRTCKVTGLVISFSQGLQFSSLMCFNLKTWRSRMVLSPLNVPWLVIIISLFVSLCVSGMGRDPVLRFWTHSSQSCCWRKAQTRFHSQGMCVCECERTTFLYFYQESDLDFCFSLSSDTTLHCGDDVMSFGSTSLPPHHCWHFDLYTSVTSYPPMPNDRPASTLFISLSRQEYSTPPPFSSRLQSKLLRVCAIKL